MTGAAQLWDPRNLIREAYRIEGITAGDCRSIFLDWVMGLKDGQTPAAGAAALLEVYAAEPADHPMTALLAETRDRPPRTGRRAGGAMGRRRA